MKICLFSQSVSNSGGIERMTIELANLLVTNNYEVHLILIEEFTKSQYPIHRDIIIHSLESTFSLSSYFKNILGLRKVIKQINPSYLISVAVPLVRISAPALWNTQIKNIAWEHFNLYAGSKKGFYWRLLSTQLVWKTIVLTELDKKNYLKHIRCNIQCIPNFTSIRFRAQAKIDSHHLIAVGRLERQKGFDYLLDAWAEVTTSIKDWNLSIVGSGSLKNELEAQAKRLGIENSVEFKPATQDIASVYQEASCLVMSSRFEGLPMVLIEAKTAGLPCVSFDCPYGPSEIIRDQVDGLLVPYKDTHALANHLKQLLPDREKLKEMGKAAHEDAVLRFSQQAIFSQWDSLLK